MKILRGRVRFVGWSWGRVVRGGCRIRRLKRLDKSKPTNPKKIKRMFSIKKICSMISVWRSPTPTGKSKPRMKTWFQGICSRTFCRGRRRIRRSRTGSSSCSRTIRSLWGTYRIRNSRQIMCSPQTPNQPHFCRVMTQPKLFKKPVLNPSFNLTGLFLRRRNRTRSRGGALSILCRKWDRKSRILEAILGLFKLKKRQKKP